MAAGKPKWIFSDELTVDKGWTWMLVLLLFGINLVTFGFMKSFGVIFSRLLIDYGDENADKFALAPVIFGIGAGVGPVGISLAQRFNNRIALVFGNFLVTFGIVAGTLVITAEAPVVYIIFGITTGFGLGISVSCSIFIIAHYFSTYITMATSLVMSGSSIGGLICPYIFHMLIDEYGLYGGMLLCAGFVLQSIPLSCLVVTDCNQKRKLYRNLDPASDSINSFHCKSTDDETLSKNAQNDVSEISSLTRNDADDKTSEDKTSDEQTLLVNRSTLKTSTIIQTLITEFIVKVAIKMQNQFCEFFAYLKQTNIKEILKIHIIRQNPIIVIYIISFSLTETYIVTMNPIIPARAVDMKISKETIALLITEIGAADIIGRIIMGRISDLECFLGRRIAIHGMVGFVLGLTIFVHVVFPGIVSLHILSVNYGLFGGAFWTIMPAILVEEFGLEAFQDVYSIIMPFMIPTAILSNVLCQNLRVWSGTWNLSLIVTGIECIMSAAILTVKLLPTRR